MAHRSGKNHENGIQMAEVRETLSELPILMSPLPEQTEGRNLRP